MYVIRVVLQRRAGGFPSRQDFMSVCFIKCPGEMFQNLPKCLFDLICMTGSFMHLGTWGNRIGYTRAHIIVEKQFLTQAEKMEMSPIH